VADESVAKVLDRLRKTEARQNLWKRCARFELSTLMASGGVTASGEKAGLQIILTKAA
jgi:hypothetical protein